MAIAHLPQRTLLYARVLTWCVEERQTKTGVQRLIGASMLTQMHLAHSMPLAQWHAEKTWRYAQVPWLATNDSFCNFYCGPNEMTCPGNNGDGTCLPMPQNCMPQCPMQCGEDQMLCPQAPDGQGCPMHDDCQPSKAAKAECPAHCPTRCGQNDLTCSQGTDGQGCPMPDICVHNDPTAICQHSCPIGPTCPEGEFACPGAKDDRGCQMAEVCSAKGECPKA